MSMVIARPSVRRLALGYLELAKPRIVMLVVFTGIPALLMAGRGIPAPELFWGTRSYNFHSNYGLSAGLLGEFRYGLGDSRETSIVIAAQIDVVAISLPFLFLINAIRGGSKDAAPVK